MSSWRVEERAGVLRMAPVRRRAIGVGVLGERSLTWADLLIRQLDVATVLVLYFPSRFDLPVDAAAQRALGDFGRATGRDTVVYTWDPTDVEFGRALALFDLPAPPALVLAAGRLLAGGAPSAPAEAGRYSIAITDPGVLADRERLAGAVNRAHEVLLRGDPDEIGRYLRGRDEARLLAAIARIAGELRDEIVKLKPKFGLPGGISIQVGG